MHRPAIALGRVPINKPLHAPLTRIKTVLWVVIRMECLEPAHTSAVLAVKIRAVVPIQAILHVALPGRRFGSGRQVLVPASGPVVVRMCWHFVPFDEAEVGWRASGYRHGGGYGSGIYCWCWGLGQGGA